MPRLYLVSTMNTQTVDAAPNAFDWPLAYEAESLLRRFIEAFLNKNSFAKTLAQRLQDESGTDFYEWVDHFTLSPEHAGEVQGAGLVREEVDALAGTEVYYHPKAMMPRVLIQKEASRERVPLNLALRPESLIDFLAAHDIDAKVHGSFGSGYREAVVATEGLHRLWAVERLADRSFVRTQTTASYVEKVLAVRELWRTRKRNFADDAQGVRHAFEVQQKAINLVGRDVACELFFAEERHFWERRNGAGRIQKRRQDLLGLGWGNHDHHTFRCSRALFADLIRFLREFGFEKRERYYAGAEAGWGAQILEHSVTGITVFADVDLMPEETEIDFSTKRLPEAPRLRTVGLWCGLHGDSLLQAGMHHLEARFDFSLLRDQLASEGVNTMKPFSDFAFLKQAFTEGERWRVAPGRIETLLKKGLITPEQADGFKRDGAVGSHLENLQRKGGFKGFNQKAVSVIIEATDPRALQATHANA